MMWLKTVVSVDLNTSTVCGIRVPPLTYWAPPSSPKTGRVVSNMAEHMKARIKEILVKLGLRELV